MRGEEEVDALIVNEAAGIYSGTTDPWQEPFYYPPGSIYINTSGIYQLKPGASGQNTSPSDWQNTSSGSGFSGNLNICLFGGGSVSVPVQQSLLQVCLHGGGQISIPLQ